MNRRESIKSVIGTAGVLVSLPLWAHQWDQNHFTADSTFLSREEHATLRLVTQTILPDANGIGAVALGVDKFLSKLFTDCYSEDVQNNISAQLRHLESFRRTTDATSFSASSQTEREGILIAFAASSGKAGEFFDLMKKETIRGFNTSKEVMLNYHKYVPVPGHYYGCVELTR
jgi:hypothetical protein